MMSYLNITTSTHDIIPQNVPYLFLAVQFYICSGDEVIITSSTVGVQGRRGDGCGVFGGERRRSSVLERLCVSAADLCRRRLLHLCQRCHQLLPEASPAWESQVREGGREGEIERKWDFFVEGGRMEMVGRFVFVLFQR